MPYAKDAAPGTYDAIIVDSSDPVGPASVGAGASLISV